MEKFMTWLEKVEALDNKTILESVLSEAPHVHFVGGLPPEFSFLQGAFVDLGFENYDNKAGQAIIGTGVTIPGTRYRFRTSNTGHTQVENADGTEKDTLPPDWKSYVCVLSNDDKWTWVGKKVRPDQVGNIDHSKYHDRGEGWEWSASTSTRSES